MTTESVHAWIADADLFLPAEGLSLLGEYQGSGYAGRRFQVGRSNGQVIQLSLQLYLIMAAIAEGGVDGGWSADQVGAQVGAASGQGLTADNVRYLVAGTLAPLGLIAAGGADRPDGAPGTAQPPRVNLLPGLKIRDVLPHLRAGGGGGGRAGGRRPGRGPADRRSRRAAAAAAAAGVPRVALGARDRRDSRAGVGCGGRGDHGGDRKPGDGRHAVGVGVDVDVSTGTGTGTGVSTGTGAGGRG
jgi:hypothetical protein